MTSLFPRRSGADAIATTAGKAMSFAEVPGEVLMKAKLFDEGLQTAPNFHDKALWKFVALIV